MGGFPFDAYTFKILSIERPRHELSAHLVEMGYTLLCTITDYGETLWVRQSIKESLDLTKLPSDCQKSSSRKE